MIFKILTVLAVSVVTSAATPALTPDQLRERFQLQADIYVTDASGKQILAGPIRTNLWRINQEKNKIDGDWSCNVDGETVAIKHSWEITENGNLKVYIEEFAKIGGDRSSPTLSDSLDKKEFVVEDFSPVVWKVKNGKNQHLVVRYIPSLREVNKPVDVNNLPIAATGITVSDNSGYLWAQDVTFGGKYSGMTSHRGTLAISYSPFSGSKEMGFAEGNQITLNIDKKYQINLKAATSFLPAGVTAKVYAIYMPEKKSKGFNSLHTFDTSREERIKEVMRK